MQHGTDPHMNELIDLVDRELEDDRRFFIENPDRSYRIRRTFAAETRAVESWGSPPKKGRLHFTVVRQLAPGARVRLHYLAPPRDDLSGAPEEIARRVFHMMLRTQGPGPARWLTQAVRNRTLQ